jgi:membrane associated rhomboid family serine protease
LDPVVLIVIAVIVATLAFSWWKQLSYSILVSVACVAVFIAELVPLPGGTGYVVDELLFMPGDLRNPGMLYTVLTSMYAHAGLTHLLFNVIGVILIGMVLEQRIGTRPYILLYLLTGLAGTLTFAAFHFDEPLIGVLGASGAISGVLGAFARLFPNERMSLFIMFIPLPPMPIWVVVAVFLGLQMLYSFGSMNIAWEAHLGGLVAGLLLAPVVVKMPMFRRAKRTVSRSSLRRLAVTPELRSILGRIEHEDLPEVRSAWVEKFLSEARCPYCGSRLKPTKESIMCEKGHLL